MCYVYQIEQDWFTTVDLAGANSNDPEGCTVGRADFFIRIKLNYPFLAREKGTNQVAWRSKH